MSCFTTRIRRQDQPLQPFSVLQQRAENPPGGNIKAQTKASTQRNVHPQDNDDPDLDFTLVFRRTAPHPGKVSHPKQGRRKKKTNPIASCIIKLFKSLSEI